MIEFISDETEAIKVLRQHPGLLTWLLDDERSLAAATIVAHCTGLPCCSHPLPPLCLEEFVRCLQLLDTGPTLRSQFSRLMDTSRGEWRLIVREWDSLQRLADDKDVDPEKFSALLADMHGRGRRELKQERQKREGDA